MTLDAAVPQGLIKLPQEIDSVWLTSALQAREPLQIISVTRIGTGQMSQSHRVVYTGAGQAQSVVVKLASDDATSRATGVGMRAYFREVSFYQQLAPRVRGSLPGCHLAVYDEAEGWFTLVLEDIADATQGDQIAGCNARQAELAIRELARVHAPFVNDIDLSQKRYLDPKTPINQTLMTALLPGFLARYAGRITPEHAEVCKAFVAVSDAWLADRRPPLGLVHGDFRLDNLLFTPGGCTVVDWQTVTWGPAMLDVSYFLGSGLNVDDRRQHEQQLVRVYHDELLACGVRNFDWDTCWLEYRRQTFLAVLMAIVSAMVVARTERGDEMFLTVLARACTQILDLDSLSLLPAPAAKPAALVPKAEDEGLHAPGPEPTWNESWYFDAVSASGDIGVYVRLGRLPNQKVCIYTAAIVRPGKPALMIVDYLAPLPAADDADAAVNTPLISATHHCEVPLERFSISLAATAEAYQDASGVFRHERGEATTVGLALSWQTEGQPYAWRASTRYEIPCRVSGSVEIDGERITFSGPGQRDHSWGSRDWWANDWMWCAFHLDDGTRMHVVTTPQMPGYAVGYAQRDGVLTEIEGGSTTEALGVDGMVAHARLQMEPGGAVLDIEPLAFGPLVLTAPDGREAHFQRTMARVTTEEGRSGLGWIEWNRVQRPLPA